jgi:hypothetical protein
MFEDADNSQSCEIVDVELVDVKNHGHEAVDADYIEKFPIIGTNTKIYIP